MSSDAAKVPAPKKRGTRFVPLEDVPGPGLSDRARELVALAVCGFALYALLSLATFQLADLDAPIPSTGLQNLGGAVGYYLAYGFTLALGYAGWVPFLLLLAWALCLFVGRPVERLVLKALGAVVCAALLAVLFAGADGYAGIGPLTPEGAGGRFGRVISPKLDAAFGGTGRYLLVGFGALVSLLLCTEWLFSQLVLRLASAVEALWRRLRHGAAAPVPAVAGAGLELAPVPAKRRRARRADGAAGGDAAADGDDGDDGDDEPADAAAAPPPRSRRRAAVVDDPDEADEPAAAPGRRAAAAADDDDDDEAAAAAADDADEPVVELPRRERRRRGAAAEEPAAAPAPAAAEPQLPPPPPPPPPPPVVLAPKPVVKPKPAAKPKAKPPGQSTLPFDEAYPFPPIELFQEALHADLGATSEVLNRGGQAIVQKLASFDVQAEVVAASVGPAVTQYELRLADGIRVNKVVTFESDLAAALKALSVRIVAPIPGKDTIGIEVPNSERQKVFMRDLLEQFGRAEDKAIPLFLGKDVGGAPIVEDLARMPHLLIAGTTGSGKSVCINTILLSILMTRTPQQVQLILVDPKMVELQAYRTVPHLCCDVVTNMKKAPGVLQWAVEEMETRYTLLSAAGVNHIKNYNRLGLQELRKRVNKEPDPDRVQLPYIVIVIDEFADLMNVAQQEVEESIQRLAQKSRAVGMHVILATQRPSSEVITGIIKANLPCQIAFKVNRRIDSRVILDANGAEKLLGHGDMLYMPPGGGALTRAQGTFVADDELQAVVRFLEEHGQRPSFNPALVQTQTSSRTGPGEKDELYARAVEIVLGQQRGSATLLQRALAVGYTRASRLLELMEQDGVVGPFSGSKSRDVLMTLEEYQAREAAMAEALAASDGDAAGEAGAEAGDGEAAGDGAAAGAAAAGGDVDGDVDGEADGGAAEGADEAPAQP